MDPVFLLIAVLTGIIYACIGYAASGEEFDATKFLRTLALVTSIALGLDVPLDFDVLPIAIYVLASLSPTTITVFIEKLLNTATVRKQPATKLETPEKT